MKVTQSLLISGQNGNKNQYQRYLKNISKQSRQGLGKRVIRKQAGKVTVQEKAGKSLGLEQKAEVTMTN